jgi:hypothetical protein
MSTILCFNVFNVTNYLIKIGVGKLTLILCLYPAYHKPLDICSCFVAKFYHCQASAAHR